MMKCFRGSKNRSKPVSAINADVYRIEETHSSGNVVPVSAGLKDGQLFLEGLGDKPDVHHVKLGSSVDPNDIELHPDTTKSESAKFQAPSNGRSTSSTKSQSKLQKVWRRFKRIFRRKCSVKNVGTEETATTEKQDQKQDPAPHVTAANTAQQKTEPDFTYEKIQQNAPHHKIKKDYQEKMVSVQELAVKSRGELTSILEQFMERSANQASDYADHPVQSSHKSSLICSGVDRRAVKSEVQSGNVPSHENETAPRQRNRIKSGDDWLLKSQPNNSLEIGDWAREVRSGEAGMQPLNNHARRSLLVADASYEIEQASPEPAPSKTQSQGVFVTDSDLFPDDFDSNITDEELKQICAQPDDSGFDMCAGRCGGHDIPGQDQRKMLYNAYYHGCQRGGRSQYPGQCTFSSEWSGHYYGPTQHTMGASRGGHYVSWNGASVSGVGSYCSTVYNRQFMQKQRMANAHRYAYLTSGRQNDHHSCQCSFYTEQGKECYQFPGYTATSMAMYTRHDEENDKQAGLSVPPCQVSLSDSSREFEPYVMQQLVKDPNSCAVQKDGKEVGSDHEKADIDEEGAFKLANPDASAYHQENETADDAQDEAHDEFWENAYEDGQWRTPTRGDFPPKLSPRMKYEVSKAWADTPVDRFGNRRINHETDSNCLELLTSFAKDKVSQLVGPSQVYDSGGTGESDLAHSIRIERTPSLAVQTGVASVPSDTRFDFSFEEEPRSQGGLYDIEDTHESDVQNNESCQSDNEFSQSDDRFVDSNRESSNPHQAYCCDDTFEASNDHASWEMVGGSYTLGEPQTADSTKVLSEAMEDHVSSYCHDDSSTDLQTAHANNSTTTATTTDQSGSSGSITPPFSDEIDEYNVAKISTGKFNSFPSEYANDVLWMSNLNEESQENGLMQLDEHEDFVQLYSSAIDRIKEVEFSDDEESRATSISDSSTQSLVEAGKDSGQNDTAMCASSSANPTQLGIAARMWSKCLAVFCFLPFLLSCLKCVVGIFVKRHVFARMDNWLERYGDDPNLPEQVETDAALASDAAGEAGGFAPETPVSGEPSKDDGALSDASSEETTSSSGSSRDVDEYRKLCKEAIRILRELDTRLDVATDEDKPIYLNLMEDFLEAAQDLFRESMNKGEVAAGDN